MDDRTPADDPPEWLDPEDCTDEELGRGEPLHPDILAALGRRDRQVREKWRYLADDPLPESPDLGPDTVDTVVRAVRWRTGVSQRQLAVAAGLSPTSVERLEAAASDPRLSTVSAVLRTAGLRLVVVDAEGTQLAVPFDQNRRRDGGDRRVAAHRPQRPLRRRRAIGVGIAPPGS